MGEFQADIGIELAPGDFVEQLMVKLGAGPRLVGVGDIFPEIIDGNAGARLIDRLRRAQRVFHLRAGNEAAGDPLTNGGALGHRAQGAALRERNEERPQHGIPSKRGRLKL